MRYLYAAAFNFINPLSAHAKNAFGQHMPGWSCKMLNLTEKQLMDFSVHVPVRASASLDAPVVGYASETVAVKDGSQTETGFTQALFPTGRPVWIATDMLKDWHAAANPSSKCSPVLKANGKPGFTYTH